MMMMTMIMVMMIMMMMTETYLTNGEWIEGYVEIQIHVFNMIYIFSPTVIANVKGIYPRF